LIVTKSLCSKSTGSEKHVRNKNPPICIIWGGATVRVNSPLEKDFDPMNAITKISLNALMIVVVISPLTASIFSASADAACRQSSGKPGRLESGGSRAVPSNFIQAVKD
jgi:hypothetical protein